MRDDEIRRALADFTSVWLRVSGFKIKLPDALVLMPRKKR